MHREKTLLLFNDRPIFQDALKSICLNCKLHKSDDICGCYAWHKADCPCKAEIELIECWCDELQTMINDRIDEVKNFRPDKEDWSDFDRDAYLADAFYKSERERPEYFGFSA